MAAIRGAIARILSGTAGKSYSPRGFPTPSLPPDAASEPTAQQAFTDIYRHAIWGQNAQGAGRSGPGSTLRATLIYRTFLRQFLRDNDIRSVVDGGCGDWEFSQAIDWSGIDYKGFDIVESNITHHKEKHEKPNIQFFLGNLVELDLPPADLLICKHVLQHLPTRDVQIFLTQLTKYKHVLLTNSVNAKTMSAANSDIVVGGYRELDPTAPPFNLSGTKVLTYWDGLHMQQVVHIAGSARSTKAATFYRKMLDLTGLPWIKRFVRNGLGK